MNSRVLFLELKSEDGRLSPEQKQLKINFLYLGHKIHQVRSYKRFSEIINNANMRKMPEQKGAVK